MAVEIQEVEVIPSAPAPPAVAPAAQPGPAASAPPAPELELHLERAARLRRSRDLRLHAD